MLSSIEGPPLVHQRPTVERDGRLAVRSMQRRTREDGAEVAVLPLLKPYYLSIDDRRFSFECSRQSVVAVRRNGEDQMSPTSMSV